MHFHLRSLTFCWKTPCSDYFSVGFLVTISLHFYLNENVFILPSVLKDIFTGHRIFLWQLFSFNCVCTHHSLSRSSHHFFWKVNCQFTIALLKGIYLRFSLYRCHHILLWYFVFILFEVYRARVNLQCYLSLVLKDCGQFIFKHFFSSTAPLVYFHSVYSLHFLLSIFYSFIYHSFYTLHFLLGIFYVSVFSSLILYSAVFNLQLNISFDF